MKYTRQDYDKMLEELFAKHPTVQNSGFTAGAYKPGLSGMKHFDEALGHPSKKFRSIHIAGTNGKGSVSSMLAASLAATGLRVGLYTSPHLVDFRERIKIVSGDSFEMVPRDFVWDFVTGHELDGLSFFEITTGMAFKWFSSEKVDIAVIETGLGGRLDSTNIITPELSIITSIGLDHCALLGDTREKIAFDKAGIFKPDVPALVFAHDRETNSVFETRSIIIKCPLFYADDIQTSLSFNLPGPYQAFNLRTALAALTLLGIDPDMDVLSNTARITGLRGRWEVIHVPFASTQDGAGQSAELICDIGHNPQALEYNFRGLKRMKRPLIIVYGIMADKDLKGIIPFMPREAEYILAAPKGSRALPVNKLAEAMSEFNARPAGSVAEGVQMAIDRARDIPDALIYVGGSNFVVAECLSALEGNPQ